MTMSHIFRFMLCAATSGKVSCPWVECRSLPSGIFTNWGLYRMHGQMTLVNTASSPPFGKPSSLIPSFFMRYIDRKILITYRPYLKLLVDVPQHKQCLLYSPYLTPYPDQQYCSQGAQMYSSPTMKNYQLWRDQCLILIVMTTHRSLQKSGNLWMLLRNYFLRWVPLSYWLQTYLAH